MASSSSSSSCHDDMPEDVWFHILLWLPVVSLFRFKSVCKSWRSLIQTSAFTAQHLLLHHHHLKDSGSLIVKGCIGLEPHYFHLLSGHKFQLAVNLDFPHCHEPDWDGPILQIASCNGIICLNDIQHRDVFLWNPATRQFRILPKSSFTIPPESERSSVLFIFMGFGYDVKANDYKVVRLFIIAPCYAEAEEADYIRQAEVYNLSTDSWRAINDDILHIHSIHSNPKAPYNNGIYYWLASRGREQTTMSFEILSFDFSNEEFETMPLPFSIKFVDYPSLALVKEKLVCIKCLPCSMEEPTESSHFEIWVLNEYRVKESWTKLYKIGPFPLSDPIGFSEDGDFLFRTMMDFKLCLYDPVTSEIKNLPVQGPYNDVEVVVYKESLVSIK